jgi:hypothetical protein
LFELAQMASFTVAKAPAAGTKTLKGFSKSVKAAPKVANVAVAKEMMVWTPHNNKCDVVPFSVQSFDDYRT